MMVVVVRNWCRAAAGVHVSQGVNNARSVLSLTRRSMSSLCSQRSTTCSPRSARNCIEEGTLSRWGKDRRGPYFGGGGGLGVPVVSYAPRPMLLDSFSLAIIVVIEAWSAFYVSTLLHASAKIGNASVTGQLTNRAKLGCELR